VNPSGSVADGEPLPALRDGRLPPGPWLPELLELSPRGTVWGFTVQRFAPKSPPYVVPADGFVPFAVGYVELPEGVKVEAVLDCTDFSELEGDAEVTLVAAEPVPRFATESARGALR
jgi:hypothetical protein